MGWAVNYPTNGVHRRVDLDGNFIEPAEYWTNYHTHGSPGYTPWEPENEIPASFNLFEQISGENLEDWFAYRGLPISLPEGFGTNQGASAGVIAEAQQLNIGLTFQNGQWTPTQ